MQEESVMDKRSSPRSVQASKGGNLDGKFKQDGSSKSFWPARRSDNSSQRQEQPKKPNPRKNKTSTDKRPRPRSYVSPADRDRSEVVDAEGDLADEEAGVKPFPRKANWNHLLNFTYAKQHGEENRGSQTQKYCKGKPAKYNKEQFLQANCQFVVKTGGNYMINLVDPDVLVDWALIEQVLIPSYENPSCPICLYPATAAKITRCGHIYCWTCILHYLALSERSWHKCPICYEAIHKNDLKSVAVLTRSAFKKGNEITLSLMRRDKSTLFPIPVTHWTDCPTDHFKYCKDMDSEATCFQKLLLADKGEVLNIVKREHAELSHQLAVLEDNSEIVFIESAFQLLKEREQNLISDTEDTDEIPLNVSNTVRFDSNKNQIIGNPVANLDPNHPTAILESDETNSVSNIENMAVYFKQSPEGGAASQQSFFFYQALDGQHIYLNSLNARMLSHEYGSLEESPKTIKATIVELENLTMTKLLRNRFRYLKHLPLTCQFQMAELNFEPPFISPDTLHQFSEEIQKRRRARTKKVREERQRERHIEIEENKKIGKYPAARYSLNSFQQFPAYNSCSTDEEVCFKSDDFEALPSPTQENVNLTAEDVQQDESTSFAEMLRKRKPQQPNSTGTILKESDLQKPNENVVAHDSDEEGAGVPEYRVSFGDAIQQAINSMSLKPKESPGQDPKKGRKKKNKNTVLFSTSMNRSK